MSHHAEAIVVVERNFDRDLLDELRRDFPLIDVTGRGEPNRILSQVCVRLKVYGDRSEGSIAEMVVRGHAAFGKGISEYLMFRKTTSQARL